MRAKLRYNYANQRFRHYWWRGHRSPGRTMMPTSHAGLRRFGCLQEQSSAAGAKQEGVAARNIPPRRRRTIRIHESVAAPRNHVLRITAVSSFNLQVIGFFGWLPNSYALSKTIISRIAGKYTSDTSITLRAAATVFSPHTSRTAPYSIHSPNIRATAI